MNKKNLVYIILALVIVFGIIFFFLQYLNNKQNLAVFQPIQTVHVPSDWVAYNSSEWGISFKYPPTWKIIEHKVDEAYNKSAQANLPIGQLYQINLKGDNYTFIVDREGSGLPDTNYTHPDYVIDGHIAKTFENDTETGFSLYLGVVPATRWYRFIISNPSSKSKEVIDQILSTIVFK